MSISRGRIIQFLSILIVQALAVMLLTWLFPNEHDLTFIQAIGVVFIISIAQVVFWYLFINFLGWLPVWTYPFVTFVLTGALVAFLTNLVFPSAHITVWGGIGMTLALTLVNAVLGAIFSLDEDSSFDRNVTLKIARKRGNPVATTVPGILYLEIDGLGIEIFSRALSEGYMPTLKKWMDAGNYTLTGWETDFTAQTGAMQVGILEGNNDDVPAYRWWDRKPGRIVMSGNPLDARQIEARVTRGRGLCADGGASRGNMFSGDASESLFTFSTLLNRQRPMGPGFYLFLVSPYVVARLVSRFIIEVIQEWWQAWQQKRRKDKYIVSARNPAYAFLRGFIGPVLEDLTTYAVISDIARGLPAVYALYAGYDDLGHFTGMYSPEAFDALGKTDRYFGRIERALETAPRPYKIVILSDHGQSIGPTFKAAYGVSLEELVKLLIRKQDAVYASLDTNEAWDKLNAFLSECLNSNPRIAGFFHRWFGKKTDSNQIVRVGPNRDPELTSPTEQAADGKEVIVLASGCTGLICFRHAQERMTYEAIQNKYPAMLPGLLNHPGVGFVLVNSEHNGPMALGKQSVLFLQDGRLEGQDPLALYGPNARQHALRELSCADCSDLVVNSIYDPQTRELPGFENQVSHHSGLGGPQNFPFVFHPSDLKVDGTPILTAVGIYQVLRGWRDQLQPTPPTA